MKKRLSFAPTKSNKVKQMCNDGPYEGRVILMSMDGRTAVFKAKGYHGHYCRGSFISIFNSPQNCDF